MRYLASAMTSVLAILWGCVQANATTLEEHFLGPVPQCLERNRPVLLVLDLTVKGEIDDSITAYTAQRLEKRGCIKIIGVVSIFGNGESSTAEIHANMERRLPKLGCAHWPLLRGPDESMVRVRAKGRETNRDQARLNAIAALIDRSAAPITILEAGPMTVSARLLRDGYVDRKQVAAIYGVGGRMHGELFQTGRSMGKVFSFSDFNMRKDIKAVDYLVRHHGRKLTMVTYQTGIRERTVPAEVVAASVPPLRDHAMKRKKTAARLGFWQSQIPSWDTWPLRLQLVNGLSDLGCKWRNVQVRSEQLPGGRTSRARLILDPPVGKGHRAMICHR